MNEITYNTEKERLKMPEYGRAVQDMIQHAIQLPTKEERQRCAQSIVEVMRRMADSELSRSDLEQRVWDHMAFIADYKLDIEYPYPTTRLDSEGVKPEPIGYPTHNIQHHQYGHLIEAGLSRLAEMPEGEERDQLLALLANQMKLSLFNWNRDGMSNERVAADIARYTRGKIQLDPNTFPWNSVVNLPKAETLLKKKKRK